MNNWSQTVGPWFLLLLLAVVSGMDSGANKYAATSIVSRSAQTDSIHRFFDSHALSNNQRYLAYTELPVTTGARGNELRACNITLVELATGSHSVVQQSLAWAAQLGAQVQFTSINTKSILLYNTITFPSLPICSYMQQPAPDGSLQLDIESTPERCLQGLQLHGVAYNPWAKIKTPLQCPVYHASRHWAISPNLPHIQRTQRGYGLDWKHFSDSRVSWSKLPGDNTDGLHLTDLRNGQCKMLYSLQEIAETVGLHIGMDGKPQAVFGFHSKLSHDARFVLFVMRTIQTGVSPTTNLSNTSSYLTFFSNKVKPLPKVRTQHLFVLGVHQKSIQYVLSWASKPFIVTDPTTQLSNVVRLRDGNHPNWIANSHDISMNLEVFTDQPGHDGWRTVRISAAALLNSSKLPLFHQQFAFHKPNKQHISCTAKTAIPYSPSSPVQKGPTCSALLVDVLWRHGWGHPTFRPQGDYFITDAYGKEAVAMQHNNSMSPPDNLVKSPLYLVNPITGKHIQLGQFPVQLRSNDESLLDLAAKSISKAVLGRKEDRSWRCDLHPSWSEDGNFVVHNVLDATKGRRQVALTALNWSAIHSDLQ